VSKSTNKSGTLPPRSPYGTSSILNDAIITLH